MFQPPMFQPHYAPPSRPLYLALAASLLVHGLVLLIQLQQPASDEHARPPLEARLAPKPTQPTKPPTPRAETPPRPTTQPVRQPKAAPAPRILTARKSTEPALRAVAPTPKWSVAQKEDMDHFLDELATEAKNKPQPSLTERALAQARELARETRPEGHSRHRDDQDERIERIPNSPPVDPFSLELYLDSLVKKLNRSASFVKNDPRSRGLHSASIEVRLNPDGSLKSFVVVRAGDQQQEIAFVQSVVERAIPFAAFPPDILKSARSLALMICIEPPTLGGSGFGFARRPEGRGCGG